MKDVHACAHTCVGPGSSYRGLCSSDGECVHPGVCTCRNSCRQAGEWAPVPFTAAGTGPGAEWDPQTGLAGLKDQIHCDFKGALTAFGRAALK